MSRLSLVTISAATAEVQCTAIFHQLCYALYIAAIVLEILDACCRYRIYSKAGSPDLPETDVSYT